MRNLIAIVSALRLAGAAASIPPGVNPRHWQQQQTSAADACTTLNEAIQNNPQGRAIPGQLAQDCLSDLPFEPDTARQFLAELRKYIQFQSTLEALQAPPKTYLSAATDILGGLDKIGRTAYTSQYQFDLDVQNLVSSANDGHFFVWPCATSIFSFNRDTNHPMVSVSVDGRAVPQLYMARDAPLIGSSTVAVSAVATINGQKAADYLDHAARHIASQDPDARWNSLFPSLALLASGVGPTAALGAFSSPGLWPGSNTTLIGFANGTTLAIDTVARAPAGGVSTTAEGVFRQYCRPASKTARGKPKKPYEEEEAIDGSRSSGVKNDKPQATPSPSSPAQYPPTVVRDQYNQMNGFYLDGQTAVMFIPSFSSEGQPDGSSAAFADVATELVRDAVRSGRRRLVLDVSGNGGGDILRAFDLFRLFFPAALPYSATRFRRHAAADAMAAAYAALDQADGAVYPLAWRGQVEPDQTTRFGSLDDFLNAGGAAQLSAAVSALYANRDYAATSTADDPIRGYGPVAPSSPSPPYRPDDLLLVGDGVCASTCATFVHLMTNAGGVRTVAFGGRPGPGPMQIMGGVRGAQSLDFAGVYASAHQANTLLAGRPQLLSPSRTEAWRASQPIPPDAWPLRLYGGGDGSKKRNGATGRRRRARGALGAMVLVSAAACWL